VITKKKDAPAVRDTSREELRPTPQLGMSRRMPSKRLDNTLQLCVSLEDIEPRIWRRIQVPESFTLKQLHRVIQTVMGWQDSHLHEFTLSGKRYGESNPEDGENVIDERTIRLRDLPLSIGVSIGYEYDSGDSWQHQVVLEKTLAPEPGDYLSGLCRRRAQRSARGCWRCRWLRRIPGGDRRPRSRGP
jgi:hypothetical protein